MPLQDFDPSATIKQFDIAVINSSTNTILYNRPELAGSLFLTCPPDAPCSVPPPTVIRPPKTPTADFGYSKYHPAEDPGTGPYRRMITSYHQPEGPQPDGTYYAPFVTGLVTADCANGSMKTPGYAGDIYKGGWSADAEPVGPSATALQGAVVDAGLQYNNNSLSRIDDSYTPFISLSGIGFTGSATYAGDSPSTTSYHGAFRFGCGTQIQNTYRVQTSNTTPDLLLVEVAVGRDPNSGGQTKYVFVIFDAQNSQGSFNGWSTACRDCVMKYTVSIAETSNNSTQNLHDGSSFTGKWQNIQVSCGFTGFALCNANQSQYIWDNSTTLNCTEYPNYFVSFDAGQRDCTSEPSYTQGNVHYLTPFQYSGSQILIINPTPNPTYAPTPIPPPPTAAPTPVPTPTLINPHPLPINCGTPTRHCGDPSPVLTPAS